MDYALNIMNRYRNLAAHEAAIPVDALIVGGSIGRGSATKDSDLDLFLLIQEQNLADFLSRGMRQFAGLGGDVSFFRGPVFVEGFGYSFTVLYDLSLICQFNVNTYQMLIPNPMWNPDSIVLFDKSGHYSSLLRRDPISVDTKALFQETFTFFWLRAVTASKYAKQGNLWGVVSLLHDLRNQMMVLYRLMRHVPPPGVNYRFPAKGWEKQTDRDETSFLVSSLCNYDTRSIRCALLFCLDWFLRSSVEYVMREKLDFDKELQLAQKIYSTISGSEIAIDLSRL